MQITQAGFADPVRNAQSCFRAVLAAMASPGSVHSVSPAVTPPAPLSVAAASVLLTLVDGETAVYISDNFVDSADWLRFHCGCTPTEDRLAARFLLASELPDFEQISAGSDEAPETSATIILQVASLASGRAYTLSGPGLQRTATLLVTGLPDDFAARWAANSKLFPRGVDLILCADSTIVALPRSVAVREG